MQHDSTPNPEKKSPIEAVIRLLAKIISKYPKIEIARLKIRVFFLPKLSPSIPVKIQPKIVPKYGIPFAISAISDF